MLRCCYAVVIALLLVGCRTKEEVATAELDMTSWQTHLESRVDSMVRTMVWTFDSLVITELAPDAPASTPATAKRQISAKRATVSVEQEQVRTEVAETLRKDSIRAEESHEVSPPPSSSGSSMGALFIVVFLIIFFICLSRK